ncbi:MAG TPA: tyrosine-type recombinase/integrase [Acidimicrobiales bacterium]|nr:tyrosine-type recombinase/integrase [Acidimicrobiales bacterium]
MTSSSSTALVPFDAAFADPRRLALAGFLASYTGLTRDAYELDLRQFVAWCDEHGLDLFDVRRFEIESFARDLEARGRARATVARRLCTVAGFYRYAEEEGLLAHSPAVHVRRPRIDYESHATALDRNEVGALLVAAGLGSARDHALVSLLALNGLRVSEATGADIDQLALARGHRTLTILRKGGKIVTIPLAPRTARAIDLAIGERLDGPIFTGPDGARLDRHAAGRIVRRVARRAGITKPVGPHTLRHAFITAALDAGVPLRDVQEAASHADPRTTMRYDRARVSLDRHATYIVSAFSPAPPGNADRSSGAPRRGRPGAGVAVSSDGSWAAGRATGERAFPASVQRRAEPALVSHCPSGCRPRSPWLLLLRTCRY